MEIERKIQVFAHLKKTELIADHIEEGMDMPLSKDFFFRQMYGYRY